LSHVVCNDLDPAAIAAIRANAAFNRVPTPLSPPSAPQQDAGSAPQQPPAVVVPSNADAILLMLNHGCFQTGGAAAFDVIDLDPYGTAGPFLDSAMQAIADGGLLCITCTDMATLAGNHMDCALPKYGAVPVRARSCHEQALRIVLATAQAAAVRHRKLIQPLLSISVDFYVRIFVRVHEDGLGAAESGLHMGQLIQCSQCDSFWTHAMMKRQPSQNQRRQEAFDRRRTEQLERAGAKRTRDEATGKQTAEATEAATETAADADDGKYVAFTTKAKEARREYRDKLIGPPPTDAEPPKEEGPAAASGAVGTPTASTSTGAAAVNPNNSTKGKVNANFASGLYASAAGAPPSAVTSAGKESARAQYSAVGIGPAQCPCCGGFGVHQGGPVWLGPLHDAAFAQSMYDEIVAAFGEDGMGHRNPTDPVFRYYDLHDQDTVSDRPAHDGGSNDIPTVAMSRRRLLGVLRSVLAELPDVPLYYEVASLVSKLHCRSLPSAVITHALEQAGYRWSPTHCNADGLKTDAPPTFLWDVIRAWESKPENNVAADKKVPGTLALAILSQGNVTGKAVCFPSEREIAKSKAAKRAQGVRFVPNPGASWGPGSRASAAIHEAALAKQQQQEKEETADASNQ
jgi:tRNA G26 N,N-dimethylase Trm1